MLPSSCGTSAVLNIRLCAPITYCQEQYDLYSQKFGYKVESSYYVNGIPNFNFLRKASCSFGWDWGPCVPTLGIGKLGIFSYDDGYISDVKCLVGRMDDGWQIRVSIFLTWQSDNSPAFSVELCEVDTAGKILDVIDTVGVRKCENGFEASIRTNSVSEWQVAGSHDSYISNRLYKVIVKLLNEHQEVSRSVGFRTVELVRAADDGNTSPPGLPLGESFFIKVNRVPVFAKGANYIPPGVFDSGNRHASIQLLRTAVASGMNCLRVWGGGRYENDDFYMECDRLGILLWHDFMFACSLFPSHKEFLDLVTLEICQQLRRLAGHPCIAIWAGNNENEELLQALIESEKDIKEQLIADYNRLYIDTILPSYNSEMTWLEESNGDKCAISNTLVVPFWPSSPSNGIGVGGISGDQKRGDVHYWGVWHGNKPFEAYETVIPRFCSEFGFQSAPNYSELFASILNHPKGTLRPPDENFAATALNWTSPEIEYLQRSPARGNLGIIAQIMAHLRIPKNFALQVWASQLLQGLAMQKGISTWRRLQPYCMGTLYWQLNDIWTGMSWSTLNHSGSWKLSHYFVKRAYNNHSLSFKFCRSPPSLTATPSTEDAPFFKGDSLELWLTSGMFEVHSKAKLCLTVQAWNLSSGARSPTKSFELHIIEQCIESKCVWSTLELDFDKHDTIFCAFLCDSDGQYLAETEHFFVPIKRLNLSATKISTKVLLEPVSSETFSPLHPPSTKIYTAVNRSSTEKLTRISVELVSDKIALYVTLPEIAKGWHGNWSDNGFILYPYCPRIVTTTLSDISSVVSLKTSALETFLVSGLTHIYDSFAS